MFDELKAWLAAGRNNQNRSDYGERTSSHEVSMSTAYLVLSIVARENREVGAGNIETAYLNADTGDLDLIRVVRRSIR
jgi:hypothetical protein